MISSSKETRKTLLALFAFATAVEIVGSATAWASPSRPITMVMGFQAGGPADTTARILAEGMRVSLGYPVIIENVAGASGNIAVGQVARAAGVGRPKWSDRGREE